MEKYSRLSPLRPRKKTYVLLGLWTRAAFVGAAVAVGGLASLLDLPQGASAAPALTGMFVGGVFAWLAWERVHASFTLDAR